MVGSIIPNFKCLIRTNWAKNLITKWIYFYFCYGSFVSLKLIHVFFFVSNRAFVYVIVITSNIVYVRLFVIKLHIKSLNKLKVWSVPFYIKFALLSHVKDFNNPAFKLFLQTPFYDLSIRGRRYKKRWLYILTWFNYPLQRLYCIDMTNLVV